MSETELRYQTALRWLRERQRLGIEPGLERLDALLAAIGRPEHGFRSIHVAGTNGKGSVASLLAGVLSRGGQRTGLYTSPHLVEFNERIRVDGDPIAREDATDMIEGLRVVVGVLDRTGAPATYFEICTALAFMYFADRVSWAVIEAGMGGKLDATNVVSPELTIITNVGLDHTGILGHDIETIASEKAGIIKRGIPVVTAARGEALAVIEHEAAEREAPLIAVGRDYRFHQEGSKGLSVYNGTGVRNYEVGLRGRHQLENATLVVAACDALRERSVDIADSSIRDALATTQVAGRLETIEKDGVAVTIDGAHNPSAAKAVADYLSESREMFALIVGFSRDKDWPAMVEHLSRVAERAWGVPIRSPRSVDPEDIQRAMPPEIPFETAVNFEEAWERVAASGSKRLLVAGSLFLAGEAKATLTGMNLSEIGGLQ